MGRIRLFFSALCLWSVGVTAADYPVLGVHYNCAAEIDPIQCMGIHSAAVHNDLARRSVNCAKVTGVLSVVKGLGPVATVFCSSYLRVPSVTTVRSTITPPAGTVTITDTATSTVTVVTPIGFKRSAAPAEEPYFAPVHDIQARAVPAALARYAAGEVSSACRCLNLTPKSTTTVTVTALTPPPISTRVTTNVIVTITTCTTVGGPCECFNPGACCNGACSCNDNNGAPVSTCF